MKAFNIVHHDGVIIVQIDDQGHAVLDVKGINDKEILVKAINRAFHAGALTGTLLSGEVVNDGLASNLVRLAETGKSWLGGSVTRLDDKPEGPVFRVEWETFPEITE